MAARYKVYIAMWVGLMAATAMEYIVRLYAGNAAPVVVLISVVAVVQAIFVSMYYQHLRYEKMELATLPLAAVGGVVFLGVAAGFSIAMMG